MSTPTLLCVLILQRSSSTQQGAPVGGSISTLLCVLIEQRSSSIRRAPVGVYLPCFVC